MAETHPTPQGPFTVPVLELFVLNLLLTLLLMSGCSSGCVLCGADVHENPVRKGGEATLVVNGLEGLAQGTTTRVVAVRFSGQLTTPGEGTGDGSFDVSRNFEVRSTGVTPQPSIERKNLRPGQWRVTVQVESWTASCTGTVVANRGATFTFRHGQDGCTVQ
jgi:hypothetical protein